MTATVSHLVAGCLALAAFAVAIVAGLAAGNAPTPILLRAVIAMIACYPVGLVIGLVCQRVIDEHLAAEDAAIPVRGSGERLEAPTGQSAQNAKDADDVIVV